MKKILLMLVLVLSFIGCFKNEEEPKEVMATGNIENGRFVVRSNEIIDGVEIIINEDIDPSTINEGNRIIKMINKNDGETNIYLASNDSKIVKGDILFTVDKGSEVDFKVENIINLDSKKNRQKRASTDILLGDFNSDDTVDLLDLNVFSDNFDTMDTDSDYSIIYDIAPAEKGIDLWDNIYSSALPDGMVDLLDFVIFARNFGKTAPILLELSDINILYNGGNLPSSIEIGETIDLNAQGVLSDGSKEENINVNWSSDNSNIASIDTNGLLTGVSEGTVGITAEIDGISTTVTMDVIQGFTDGIKVHAKYTHIWAWQGEVDLFDVWPGEAMTSEGGEWYTYTLSGISSVSIIFSNDGGSQTSELTLDQVGEYWYDGTWHTSDPDIDTTAPEVSILPSGKSTLINTNEYEITYEETDLNINLNITDNQDTSPIAYYTTDGTTASNSSTLYTGSQIAVSNNQVINVFTVDADNNSDNYSFKFILGSDLTAPTITASPESGRYDEGTTVDITLSATDNMDSDVDLYYTIDGTNPEEILDDIYSGQTISITENTNINVLAIDDSGNKTTESFSYYFGGEVVTTRFDPRQESIYFLLTTRWFDGDPDNSVGDAWCSWTEERANDDITDDGFTGPEDVTWRGDFKGLVEKLDYIKALGFTAIWITPVVQNRSPLAYHGYHGWDFTKEDERLVSPGYDFQRLVDEIHARDMKLVLDIVINHSGRFGIKDFAEVKYARDPGLYPEPEGWEGFEYDEAAYQAGIEQDFPNDWQYDGLTSPGNVNGEPIPPYATFTGDVRPFTDEDISNYPGLATEVGANGFLKYQWPSTESYCVTIDGKIFGEPNSLDYEGYKNSDRRLRGHNTGFPTGSGSFDNYPDAHLDSLHEDCPDLNTENPEVQDYILNAYYRYIDMGVDMFRVDTVMHMHKQTLNEMYWPQLLERAEQAKDARGGSDFFIFGEVANFVNNLSDKPAQLMQSNYTWDETVTGMGNSNNHLLDGNNYRTPDYSNKAPQASSPYHVSVLDIISHNGFVDGVGGAYGRTLGNDSAYNDATYLTWYTDSHDYGPNKGETRWGGDFAAAWSMMFTYRGIPIVYYGSEIKFAQDKPNDWPGGGSAGTDMSLEKTGRSYFGPHLEGSVTASDFGEYQASGEVANTLSHELAQHLMGLNKIRLQVPALQMGQYSTEGHSGGWAGYKRRYTGTNKITGEAIDSYALVGVGEGTHSWSGVLDGTYVDCVTGNEITASGGNLSFTVANGGDAGLGVYVLKGLTTPAPGKVNQSSPYLK